MKKQDAIASFKESHDSFLKENRGDPSAKREAWNNYTDGLHKDKLITKRQYETWKQPF